MAKKGGNPQNLTPFTSDRQPSGELKAKGWERRRQAQAMMDKIKHYMDMSQQDFTNLLNDIKQNPDKYTVQEVLLAKYATKAYNGDKFMLDWIDRNISKAPQEISGPDGTGLFDNLFNNARRAAQGNDGKNKAMEE